LISSLQKTSIRPLQLETPEKALDKNDTPNLKKDPTLGVLDDDKSIVESQEDGISEDKRKTDLNGELTHKFGADTPMGEEEAFIGGKIVDSNEDVADLKDDKGKDEERGDDGLRTNMEDESSREDERDDNDDDEYYDEAELGDEPSKGYEESLEGEEGGRNGSKEIV